MSAWRACRSRISGTTTADTIRAIVKSAAAIGIQTRVAEIQVAEPRSIPDLTAALAERFHRSGGVANRPTPPPTWDHSTRRIVIREGQPDSVVADVFRPPGNEIAETPTVVGEERARRLLESGQVAGDSREKPVRRLLGSSNAIAVAARTTGRIDELSQRHGGSPWLNIQPIPVARQQRHLASDDAETGASTAARLGLMLQGLRGPQRTEVEVQLSAGVIVESQKFAALGLISEKTSDFVVCTRGDLAELAEHRAAHVANIPG